MKTFYSELFLEDFFKIKKNSLLFLPLGTLEWHGTHLPFGTDLIVATELTKRIAKKVGGVILPPLFIGTDRAKTKNKVIFTGMDLHLKKKLPGSLYYLKPSLFFKVLESLIIHIKTQGFKKLVIVTGHAGSRQIKVLDAIQKKHSCPNFKILIINPYQAIKEKHKATHAGYEETSLLWALRPDLIKKSKKAKSDPDVIRWVGIEPRIKSSKRFGKKFLEEIIKNSLKLIKTN